MDAIPYAEWVSKFMWDEYHAQFVSPFSANSSNLAHEAFLEKSGMQDATTLWEIEVLIILRQTEAYRSALYKPRIIGPDRNTVDHTINTIWSYGPSLPTEISSLRPDYR